MEPLVLLLLVYTSAASSDTSHSMKKRQIFREQVLPHSGGKIPEEAFRSDRLALNKLNAAGIAVPDGILLETRNRESHFPSHRHDPDIEASIIKLVQKPDGRYAPPEGRYPFNNLVASTYVIRKPIHSHHVVIPPQRPIQTIFRLPARPFFEADDDLFELNNVDDFDLLNTYNTDFPGSRLWAGFGPLFHDTGNRILRQTRKNVRKDLVKDPPLEQARFPSANAIHATPRPSTGTPTLKTIPPTSFKCPLKLMHHQMIPDPQASCQVFHLCHVNGSRESFLCPQGMRFNPRSSQCLSWREVPCPF
ncbi:uncharacterized protein LOC106661086 [Cimex lectularius]|uniref:Chitin-binding type-2 domain-containing protein n=1 Tax=Cimex lectularius TaxID=79782 RepID=A0A8I6R790_CIMLE|nr:uncharacterized protein LOC106661086 [Cimex lectularius]